MPKKLNTSNLFSFESHEDDTIETLDEQGTVTEADSEAVVAVAEPSADVTEAGDDVAQATPNAEIDAEPESDITADQPLEGAVDEVTKLTEEGTDAANTKTEIVAAATAEVTGDSTEDTDVNGNSITPEQAVENEAQEEVDAEVDEATEETAADKDITSEVEEVNDNVDEALGDSLGEDSTDGGVDGENLDDTSDDIDTGGDQGDLGMDVDTGDLGEPEGGDDIEADDTPLEGADDAESADTTVESSGGDVGTDVDTEDGDQTTVEADDSGELGDDTEFDDTEGVDGNTETTNDVAKQNEAADVTAEAASSDVNQTEFIADESPEQHGELPDDEVLPDNDGEPIVAEAEPAIQNQSDVGSDNANADITQSTADEVEFDEDDDTPLEINDEASLTPTEVDGQEADGPTGDGATVEESQSDQQAEAMTEAAETESTDVDEDSDEPLEGANLPEDGETEVDTETETSTDGSTEESVGDITSDSEEPGIDAEAGEIEETDEEANLEEGELDIPDVDTGTTEAEVDEATEEADAVEAEADAETEDAEKADKTIEELQKEAEALEEFRVMLEYGIANESYQSQLVAMAVYKSDKLREVLNSVGYNIPAVSLESYTGKDLDLAYQVTLESIRGVLSRLATVNHSLTQKFEKWWSKGMVDKVKSRTSALNKQVDLCLVQLKEADVSTKDVTGIGAYLAHAEGNLVKAVSDDLKAITDVSGKGFKATEDLQSNLVKALNDITAAADPAEATSIADKVSRFKDTKSAFPNRAFDKGFLGGYRFELKDATGGDSLKDKILNMGRRAVPVVVHSGKGTNSTQKLSKGDVSNLLKLAKAYVALADKLASSVGDRAVDNVGKIRLTRERALPVAVEGRIRGGDEKAIDAAASALEIVAKAHNDLYKFVTKHCIDTADALCGVAKKFTK